MSAVVLYPSACTTTAAASAFRQCASLLSRSYMTVSPPTDSTSNPSVRAVGQRTIVCFLKSIRSPPDRSSAELPPAVPTLGQAPRLHRIVLHYGPRAPKNPEARTTTIHCSPGSGDTPVSN